MEVEFLGWSLDLKDKVKFELVMSCYVIYAMVKGWVCQGLGQVWQHWLKMNEFITLLDTGMSLYSVVIRNVCLSFFFLKETFPRCNFYLYSQKKLEKWFTLCKSICVALYDLQKKKKSRAPALQTETNIFLCKLRMQPIMCLILSVYAVEIQWPSMF